MTQKDKELLLRDLCARLPYGVKIHIEYTFKPPYNVHIEKDTDLVEFNVIKGEFLALTSMNPLSPRIRFPLENIRPYLRPMSSMTEEEGIYYNTVYTTLKFYEKEDWLNENHFDYRGLIPMGLALEAPERMYKEN